MLKETTTMDNVQRAGSEKRHQEQQLQQVTSAVDLPAGGAPYTIDEAIVDALIQVTGEPFPDPFEDAHAIEYWLWTGSRLVPASPDAAERLRQQEAQQKEVVRARHKQQQAGIHLRVMRWLISLRRFSSS